MALPAHILLVDDDADQREAVVVVLRSEGHHVVEAANGQLALDALAAGPGPDQLGSGPGFGVIVLDLMMPVMDGATFLAHKARGEHAAVPVVVFSASSSSVDLHGSAGVFCVVPKQVGMDALLAAVGRACATAALPRLAGSNHA